MKPNEERIVPEEEIPEDEQNKAWKDERLMCQLYVHYKEQNK